MNDNNASLANVFYARDSEVGINEQINHEYVMSYVYHQMSSYFNRDNVSLPGIRDYFKACSLEERSHAQMLMVRFLSVCPSWLAHSSRDGSG